MIGGSSVVAPDSPPAFGNILLSTRTRSCRWLRELADDVHAHGAAVMIQITHLGRRTSWNKADWLPVSRPRTCASPRIAPFPRRWRTGTSSASSRPTPTPPSACRRAGWMGSRSSATAISIDQFWSPATNQRDDEYGGSLDNRLRFGFEVLRAIRKRVGADFLVGVRMVCDEDWERGLTKRRGRRDRAAPDVDSRPDRLPQRDPRPYRHRRGADARHPRHGRCARAPHLDFAGEVRAATRIPTFHAARIQDVATARHAIASGKLDMVGMTRAHLADPHIVRKIIEGREDEIRPCVGMGYCIDSHLCRRRRAVHPQCRDRTRGDDAARDRAAADGRAKRSSSSAPGRAGWRRRGSPASAATRSSCSRPRTSRAARSGSPPDSRAAAKSSASSTGGSRECAQLRRRVPLQRLCRGRRRARRKRPDVVVIATGGVPNLGFLDEGEDLATSSWDILSGAAQAARRRCSSTTTTAPIPASRVAEFVARAGAKLEIVTPERSLAPDVGAHQLSALFPGAFPSSASTITLNLRLERIRREGNRVVATFLDEYGRKRGREGRPIRSSSITARCRLDDLYFELKPGSVNLGEVDYDALIAVTPQTLVDAIRGGALSALPHRRRGRLPQHPRRDL